MTSPLPDISRKCLICGAILPKPGGWFSARLLGGRVLEDTFCSRRCSNELGDLTDEQQRHVIFGRPAESFCNAQAARGFAGDRP